MLSILAGMLLGSAPAEETLTILAAASLRSPMVEIQKLYESSNSSTRLEMSFAGSQELAAQLVLGAPGDLFLSADRAQIDVVVKAKRMSARDIQPFSGNRLCVIVAKRAAGKVESLGDLAKPGIRISLAGEKVPIGAYTNQMFAKATRDLGAAWLDHVRSNVVSFETNVSAIVTRVELGEADCGIVYESDARQAKTSKVIGVPKNLNVRAVYFGGVLSDSPQKERSRSFFKFLLGKEGQAVFAKYGFLPAK
ncbi:MAG: molybdate ABC transporter substrate-binding protein [Fimbriimonadaceae bacterium]|nr:molybdate ABC transporter substrate-binding protein [Fimbriimonadaceae bacterium]